MTDEEDDERYDTLPLWAPDFIRDLKAGKTEAYLAKTLVGQPLSFVQGLRDRLPVFAELWDEAKTHAANKTSLRELNPASLERALNAQVPDDRAAAYFGLSVADYKERIAADIVLQRIYDTARPAGLAIAEMAQWDEMKNGNWQATAHIAKHKLGQSDSAPPPAPQMVVNFNVANPGESYRQLLAGGTLALPDIEGEKVDDAVSATDADL